MLKEIRIDGVIGQGDGEISAAWIRSQLPQNGTDPIRVSMHSEGGSVFEGFAIYDALAKYQGQKTIAIESTAFSIASFIAMAGDEIEMAPNAYFMLHNPRIDTQGDDEDLTKTSAMIGELKSNMITAYVSRTGKTPEEIKAILKAETFFNAEQSVAFGLADRVAGTPVRGRAFAQIDLLPHGVVTALFGAGSGGSSNKKREVIAMSEQKPTAAATIQEIKSAFPKAKAEFVLTCVEKSLPMASVAAAAAEEMMKENEELKAKLKAYEEADAKAKAEAEEEEAKAKAEEEEAKAKAEEEDTEAKAEEELDAKSKSKTGVKPVAKATSSTKSAHAQWTSAVDAKVATGIPRASAIMAVEKERPGLRQQWLDEVNASR